MKKMKYLLFAFVVFSCEREDDFSPSNLSEVFVLSIENNNALADGVSKIKVISEFPSNFNTEDDQKVDFIVFKEENETSSSGIVLKETTNGDKKIAEMLVDHVTADTIKVQGTIKINTASISKEINIIFKKAYPDSINTYSSSLTIKPNSFDEIEITTELIRKKGMVSLHSIAETIVVDSLGNSRGFFNNYRNVSDNTGEIKNRFTLGDDSYLGPLKVISTTANGLNLIKKDSIIITSKN